MGCCVALTDASTFGNPWAKAMYLVSHATWHTKSAPSMGTPPSVTEITCRPRTVGSHSTPHVPSPRSATTLRTRA